MSFMREPNRQIPPERKAMYYGGMALTAVGFLLFLSNFCVMPMQFGQEFGPEFGPGAGIGSVMGGMMARAVGGMVLMIAGGVLMKIGARGWAGAGVLLDPERARRELEPHARMAGGVLNDALEEVDVVQRITAPRPEGEQVVKVRCRSCGALNDETDKYCGQCGKAV
jgi:hypothetical protein